MINRTQVVGSLYIIVIHSSSLFVFQVLTLCMLGSPVSPYLEPNCL